MRKIEILTDRKIQKSAQRDIKAKDRKSHCGDYNSGKTVKRVRRNDGRQRDEGLQQDEEGGSMFLMQNGIRQVERQGDEAKTSARGGRKTETTMEPRNENTCK